MDLLQREHQRRIGPLLNLTRIISALATGGMLREDADALAFHAARAGVAGTDPQRPFIPFSALVTRDLTKGTAGAGGYLVSAEVPEPVDILRPWSVSAQAGITIVDGLHGDQAVPKTLVKSTPNWLPTEGSAVTASTPTLGQRAATPKTAGIVINFSRQLAKQTHAEFFIRRELLRTLGTTVDQAVLTGTGASGQPLGLLNTTGLGTTTGTSLAQAGVVEMKRKVADANAPDAAIAFLGAPTVRELLEKRERATGLGFLWDNDRVASRPAYASTDVPAATLICGAWPELVLGLWGHGFVIEVNPYDPTGFKTGVIQARILVSCDVVVQTPAAFCVATSIT